MGRKKAVQTAVYTMIIYFAGMMALQGFCTAAEDSPVFTGVTTAGRMVMNNKKEKAKEKAVADALDIAVQNAFASLVSPDDLAKGLGFFYNEILSRTDDFILAYQVLGGMESRNHYLVAVESKVDMKLLEKTLTDARILRAGRNKPKILFFISEQTPSDLLPRYWWGDNPVFYQSFAEETIIEKMVRDEFMVLGVDPNRPDPSALEVEFTSPDDLEAAKLMGKKVGADMIVMGLASSSEAANNMGDEKTFNAEITLIAYLLETGQEAIISKSSAAAKGDIEKQGHIDAIIAAAELSAQELSEKILAYWTQSLRKEKTFDVRIEGEKFLQRFIALKLQMKQMPGVKNISPREMESNNAVLEVLYKGKTFQFADAVMLETFDTFGLEITKVTDSLVTIKFISREQAPLSDEQPEVSDEQPASQDDQQPVVPDEQPKDTTIPLETTED